MATGVSFKIIKKSKFSQLGDVVPGRIIFVEDDQGSNDNQIYLDYGDSRKLYASAIGEGGTPVQSHESFLGISTVEPINGASPVVDGDTISNPQPGEWVAVQGTKKEYYWDGNSWKLFGDEDATGDGLNWGDDDDILSN